ncbi:MAG: patatin-like phospholipase family protein [Chloroflexota bacterium]
MTMHTRAVASRRLLTIDGGGLGGIIPVCLLAALERQTNRRARDLFAFMAGTSTGAIIVSALAAGVPATEILEFYEQDAPMIFARTWTSLFRRALFGQMYSTRKLRDAIERRFPAAARGWVLNDVPNDILITATRLRDGKPWYFVKDHPTNARTTGGFPLLDCVAASAAAPTYFDPWPMPRPSGGGAKAIDPATDWLVDGGAAIAGNPVYVACVEAFVYSPGYEPASTVIVSLGTGRFLDQRRPTHILSWLRWILAQLTRSPGEQQTEISYRHYGARSLGLYRIDASLATDIALDDVRGIRELRRVGDALATTIDWSAILAGEDTPDKIHDTNTLFAQYAQAV